MARVVFENLTKHFKGADGRSIQAVNQLNLTLADGELLVLVGPSGCGKTTTLRLLAGLETAEGGTITMDGKVINGVAPKDRDVAMVFQNHALYPHLTARENMAFGLKLRKYSAAEIAERVRQAAEMLGLGDCLDRKPEALSGGQRQRVALGRALVRQPKVFLLDEPLSDLDAPMRAQMRREIARLHKQLGATMIYVTHDQVEAMTLGDRIAVMREGVVQQVAKPMDLYRQPANRFVAGFIGSPPMNFVNGALAGNGAGMVFEAEGSSQATGGFKVRLDDGMVSRLTDYAGRKIVLGIRPEDIADDGGNAVGEKLEMMLETIEPLGPETHVLAKSGSHVLVARVGADCGVEAGQKVSLGLDMRRAHFFDPESGKAVGGAGLQMLNG